MSSIELLFVESTVPNASRLEVFPLFAGTEQHPKMTGDIALEAARTRFEGKIGEGIWRQTGVGVFEGVVGAGKPETPGVLRRAVAHAIGMAKQLRVQELVLTLGDDITPAQAVAAAEGALLTCYDFDDYKKAKTEEERTGELERIVILAPEALQEALRQGQTLGGAVCFARDLANEQPGLCTPAWLAEQGRLRAVERGLEVTVMDEDELQAKGFGLHLAVARGSDEPARLLHAIYKPAGEVTRKIALVGKGVTFDSGGYSIKPASGMLDMHLDMGGAAAVLGAMDAIGALKPEGIEVHFIVPMAENMVSGSAYKVNEVVRGYNGTTVEVHNTDAEGRMLLADALAYAVDQGVDQVIDLATLTGACVVALGMETAGVFSTSDALSESLLAAAKQSDEALWPLPLVERMEGQVKSRVAEVKNVGGRWGGAISAALFLKRFVGETDWAHIDIAGPAMAESRWEYICEGGTGYGVLLLARFAGVDV